MAKRKPTFTLVEMESKLGYEIDSLNYPSEGVKRFYSDLRPVPESVYERIKKEFEEQERQRSHKEYKAMSENVLLECGVPQTVAHGRDTVTFTRRAHIGLYIFAVDIHYNFGLDLPLLFTKNEALRALAVSKLQPDTTRDVVSIFFKLPKELRDRIYAFAFPKGKWEIRDGDSFHELNFTGGIGDPSGFYFPLSSLTVLRLNKQIRQEALPIAYRRTVFHLDDIDDLVKLLIAVGDIGRDNIESLELAWQSRTDFECQWAEASVPHEFSLTLPTLHVAECVQLLKQCKNLKYLRLYFERDFVLSLSPDGYRADPGISKLCTLRGIERVEIWDLGYEPLEQHGFVAWVKEALESSGQQE